MPDLSAPAGDSDFYFVPAEDPETAVQRILELVKTRIPKRFGLNSIRDIQVLCPMNRGGVGARSLNIELQAALNPADERKVERFGWTFAPRDKVMQIENDYDKEVYNGDIGYIDDVDPEAGELMASFDGRSVTYGFGELDTLVPAYAATIHKSQGSEYPAVIIPVLTQHYPMLQRKAPVGRPTPITGNCSKAALHASCPARFTTSYGRWFRPRLAWSPRPDFLVRPDLQPALPALVTPGPLVPRQCLESTLSGYCKSLACELVGDARPVVTSLMGDGPGSSRATECGPRRRR